MELLEILWDLFWPVAVLVLIFVGGYALVTLVLPMVLGGALAIIFAPIKSVFKRIIAIPAMIKMKKNFDEGLKQELEKYLPQDARVIEFQTQYITIKAYNGNWYTIPFKELGYEPLPNVRYTLAMAKLVNERIMNNNNFFIREMYSKSEGGMVSDGYHTTASSSGYHTQETFTYVPSETHTYGYKLVNRNYLKKKETKPVTKKW